ncbi:hypothetical protein LCGC14_2079320 [marine sediment metagenome]|uniref:RecA family profile 2 domain-containing protein n=1 Tax=marine sediment metagenome TaxID=412755 RepID=A0A0F9F3E3_9ZZZZ
MNKPPIRKKAAEIKKVIKEEPVQLVDFEAPEGNFNYMISSGSTLLDLAISGGRIYGGGIPAGIIIEIFGPPSVGKTAILAEIIASVQIPGGDAWVLDPEGRMDKQYMKTYDVIIDEKNYSRPRTVPEVFDVIKKAAPAKKGIVNCVATDGLAALSTDLELKKGDKMGMRRGKEFSEGLRTTAIDIREKLLIVASSNQIRHGERGEFTPGGNAYPFYSSLRIRMWRKSLIERERTITEKGEDPDALKGTFSRKVGQIVECEIVKSSLDEPFRVAPVYIVFDYGLHDIMANLQFNKNATKNSTMYECGDGKEYVALNDAVKYVEDNSLEDAVQERTRKLWYKIQKILKVERKPKTRS